MILGLPPVKRRIIINLVLCMACGFIMYAVVFFAQNAIGEAEGTHAPLEVMLPFYIAVTALMAVWVFGIAYLAVRDIRAERLGKELVSAHEQLVHEREVHDKTVESILATYQQLTYIDLVHDEMEVVYAKWTPQFKKSTYSDVLELYKTHSAIVDEDVGPFVEIMSIDNLRKELAEDDVLELKLRMNHPGGTPETCIATVAVIDREDGVPVSVAFSIRSIQDVLAKDRAHRDMLAIAVKQAEAASKAKGEFLSRVSHDMRTPLNAIRGMTAIASMNADDKDRVLDSLRKIDSSSEHLLEIIDEVLDISKIESGRIELSEEPIDLREVVESVRSMLAPQAAGNDVALRFACDHVEHPYVTGDAAKLRELLSNIAGNSVKFTNRGGTVSLGVEETSIESLGKRAYIFTVADNGIGMAPEFLERIFEPFSRAEDESVRSIEGSGLGMPIAMNLARLMGGDITVESELGKGSCFKVNVYLGIADKDSSDGARDASASTSTLNDARELSECDFSGHRALVVDDVDVNAEIACELLAATGMESESASDGAKALEAVLAHEPGYYDIVFMDVQMPVMDGYETTRRIRAAADNGRLDLEDLPIVAMTANAFADDARDARDAGMDGHIAKPVSLKVLKECLTQWLG